MGNDYFHVAAEAEINSIYDSTYFHWCFSTSNLTRLPEDDGKIQILAREVQGAYGESAFVTISTHAGVVGPWSTLKAARASDTDSSRTHEPHSTH